MLNICTFYYDSRRYFSYIVRRPSSHYLLYAFTEIGDHISRVNYLGI